MSKHDNVSAFGASSPTLTIDEYVDLYMAVNEGAKRKDVAQHLGISGAYLCQVMSGQRHPSIKQIEKIAYRTGGMVSFESWLRHMIKVAA